MHPRIQTFLASITALHQLEPKQLPKDVIEVMLSMSPEDLFKTCTQLATLQHNIPGKEKPITLDEADMARLAQEYLKCLLEAIRSGEIVLR